MGAYAENDHVFENLLLEFFRDHAYWRRNFHPEDPPPIPTNAPYRDLYNEFLAKMQQELHTLSAELKRSIPYFSPRYMGQMASDFLLPAHLAQIMTSFYHPNNVYDDTIPATMNMEVEVGYQLAAMFGMPTESKDQRHAWGHLCSGGTTANYEALWYMVTAKYMPITINKAFASLGLELSNTGPKDQKLSEYSTWELLNFSVKQCITLWRQALHFLHKHHRQIDLDHVFEKLRSESFDYQGTARFYANNPEIKPPIIIVTRPAPMSWRKAANIFGIGRDQLIQIPTDHRMRIDLNELEALLSDCLEKKIPVFALIGNLGTTNFGSIDSIGDMVQIRKRFLKKGLYFGLHIDASWGGYLTAMFRNRDGSLADLQTLRKKLKFFPQPDTLRAFASLSEVDSLTVDPQKLGYLPFPCGAYINSDGGVLDFFLLQANITDGVDFLDIPLGTKFAKLTQFSLEGAKPGARAAATYITHRCLPLHREGFGQVLQLTMEASEYFFEKIQAVKKELENFVHLVIPFTPDTNILCFAINPQRNRNIAIMNHFSKKIFKHLKFNPSLPLQGHKFFVSSTHLAKEHLTAAEIERIFGLLDLDPQGFTTKVEDRTIQARGLFLFRHAVMNPWLLYREDPNQKNYIDRYFDYFTNLIKKEMSRIIGVGKS